MSNANEQREWRTSMGHEHEKDQENDHENGGATPERKYDHHRLRVYEEARAFLRWRATIGRRLPRKSDLGDQLTRAATSIILNIAEACGEFSGPDRVRFFRIARRSATECDAVLDILESLGLETPSTIAEGRAMLSRTTAMLTRLIARGRPA